MTGVVVVGTGFGCFTHVRALRAAGFEVQALVGRDPAKTELRAQAVDVPRACTSFADALALPGVDAVTIATPPHTHAPLVLSAIEAGKHVLCEKPFARDAAEARTLLAAAQDARVVDMLGTEFRFDAGQALLARAVHEGAVGEPRLAMFLLHAPVLADRDAGLPDWWADATQGGGWLGAHGSQVIDQIRVTLGEFDTVTASLLHLARTSTADDGFVVDFRLASGVVGVMQSTAADRGPFLIETRVVGTRGTAWIDGLGHHVWVADARGTQQLTVPDDLRTAAPSAPPRDILTTTYEQMIGHGLDLGPYTRLAEHFRARIEGTEAPPAPAPRRSPTESRTWPCSMRCGPQPRSSEASRSLEPCAIPRTAQLMGALARRGRTQTISSVRSATITVPVVLTVTPYAPGPQSSTPAPRAVAVSSATVP